jgi:hypothetical protein
MPPVIFIFADFPRPPPFLAGVGGGGGDIGGFSQNDKKERKNTPGRGEESPFSHGQ